MWRRDKAPDVGFGRILAYMDWWDCPRSGICEVNGVPFRFESTFSEELDDYAPEFDIWVATDDELADEMAAWRSFVS